MENWIFGHHAVEAAISAGKRPVLELFLTDKNVNRYREYKRFLNETKITVAGTKDLNRKFPEKTHQGIAAKVGEIPKVYIEEIVEEASLLLILDQVTDPHNIGACLRSANAFGADAMLIPTHGSAGLTDVAAKASVGAAEYTPVIEVGNLNKTIAFIQKQGFWIVGLDGYAEQELSEIDMSGKIAIIMGNEGKGLRDLVKKNCDFTAKLPMSGQVESLNVSVATGVALYEASKQRVK
jgi:23S rRNA (guanosine2251-2'-O)-methyltransferase